METLIERLLDTRQDIHGLLADPEQKGHLVKIPLPSRSWFYNYVRWFTTQSAEGNQIYATPHSQPEWDANFLLLDHLASRATLPL